MRNQFPNVRGNGIECVNVWNPEIESSKRILDGWWCQEQRWQEARAVYEGTPLTDESSAFVRQ